ncbi:MAG TPA: beta galactosidase jelly roll domain-containing protein [Cyclobacteriaceae bacterium]|nr:beta galactosidase jelly roll domain-containing protein [Cyclobacteriaceae bacterium]
MKTIGSLLLVSLIYATTAFSQVINLEGEWKFHIDDEASWASPTFDDSRWESIHAPSAWEEQGFNGYDGFAWYRRKFDGRLLDRKTNYYLGLGYIDDADEVYVNGRLIGFSGSMPPRFKTAFNNERKYILPVELINFHGENTIAIRVFDITQGGGIVDGDLGVFRSRNDNFLLVDLQGVWSFALSNSGDEMPRPRDNEWKKIMVPGAWEYNGYKYDGFAWYKRTFTIPLNYSGEPLVLVLGKIDDFDKVYLNGQQIGSTNDHRPFGSSHSFEELRAYKIPSGVLKKIGANTVEVFVEDMGNWGGIYEGPVGVATKANVEKYLMNNQ